VTKPVILWNGCMELNANQPNTDVDNAKKSAEFHLFYLFMMLTREMKIMISVSSRKLIKTGNWILNSKLSNVGFL
jgi:hypothetical protein